MMESIPILNLNLVYVWKILDNIAHSPEDSIVIQKLSDLLNNKSIIDTQSYDAAFYVWQYVYNQDKINVINDCINNNNSLDDKSLVYLSQLRETIEDTFKHEIVQIDSYEVYNDCLNAVIELFNEYTNTYNQEILGVFIGLMLSISTRLKFSIDHSTKETYFKWDHYALYLLLKGYSQFFDQTTFGLQACERLDFYYDFLNTFNLKSVIPLYFVSDEDNIVIEPAPFPNEMHYRLCAMMEIELDEVKNPFILNYLSRQFVDNDLLTPLFAHEIGHVIDRNFINIDTLVSNNLVLNHPEFYMTLDKRSYQWIREIIADAFAICLHGPAYLLALIDFMDSDEAMHSSITHPGIVFRTKIMYTYLFQNEYINLISPKSYAALQEKLQFYQDTYPTEINHFIAYENILQQYIPLIYSTVIEYLQNAGKYTTYNDLTELICFNEGSIEKAQDELLDKKLNFKDFLNLENLKWLIELKDRNY